MKLRYAFILFAFIALGLGAYWLSQPEIFKFRLKEVSFEQTQGWKEDSFTESYPALQKSCGLYLKRSGQIHEDPRFGSYEDWKPFCSLLMETEAENIRPLIEQKLKLYLVETKEGEGLFTGYYEPLLKGSFEKSKRYATALFPKPKGLYRGKLSDFLPNLPEDLKDQRITARVENGALKPYFTRGEIEKGLLADTKPLMYVDSPIDAFFLHIQGSGRIQLPTGKLVNLGYAGQNGHKYQAIGRYMADKGYLKLEEVSLQSIRKFLLEHPEKQQEIFNQNPSFIFFAHKTGGPYGSLGVELTPERSLAIDPKQFPLGLPLFLNAERSLDEKPFRKLMSAQDTGGAIKGVLRGDIYFGFGEKPEEYAGHQKSVGQFHILLPRLQQQ